MFAKLIALTRRLTRLEWLIIAWAAGLPVILGVVVILAALFELGLAAAVALIAYYLCGIVAIVLALLSRLRRRRKFVALQEEQSQIVLLPPFELASSGLLADHPAEWAEIDSRELEHRRVIRWSATAPVSELLSLGLRSKSEWVREPLTYRATQGRLDYPALARILLASDLDESIVDMLLKGLDPDVLLMLGRMVAGQATGSGDHDVVEAIEGLVLRLLDRDRIRLNESSRRWLAERLLASDRLEAAIPLVSEMASRTVTSRLLQADILNPFRQSPIQTSQELWLASLNSIYDMYGLEPIILRSSGPTPYDRLGTEEVAKVSGGPLISVIMSCFKPSDEIRTAVDSMIAQSWQNWELLIADDASPEKYGEILAELSDLDPRIKVLRFGENRGTYIRRNDALLEARGEFVTMQDSDDWVHPRRLELQARHLIANPGVAANLSYSLRVTENLAFVQPRGAKLRIAETSLFFRRDEVVGRIGYFDSVRKAADSEFRLRLEAAFGEPAPILDTLSPLSLVRYTATSLSGSDIGDGWMAPERMAYMGAARFWHERIRSEGSPAVVRYPLSVRPFPAHEVVLGRAREHRELDIVLVLDGRSGAHAPERLRDLVAEIEGLLGQGRTVGLLHVLTLATDQSSPYLDPALQKLVNDGQVVQVLLGDDLTVDTMLVRYAGSLQAVPQGSSSLRTRRLIILEDPTGDKDVRGRTFARAEVEDSAARVFGLKPEWIRSDGAPDYHMLLGQPVMR